jgi:hypothetical protein
VPSQGAPSWRKGLRELALVIGLYLTYTASRLLAASDVEAAAHRAHRLVEAERVVDLDWEVAVNHLTAQHEGLALLSCYWYSTAHYLVTPLALVWLYRRGRHVYLRARTALVIATLVALGVYLLLPTAPPRMLPAYGDLLAIHASAGWWGGDASAPSGLGGLTNELAAFPSLHAGWSLWVALAVHRWAGRRRWKALGWLHAGLTAFAVVGTANHWTLDVVAGWLVVVLAWVASDRLAGGRSRGSRHSTAGSPAVTSGPRQPTSLPRGHGTAVPRHQEEATA